MGSFSFLGELIL